MRMIRMNSTPTIMSKNGLKSVPSVSVSNAIGHLCVIGGRSQTRQMSNFRVQLQYCLSQDVNLRRNLVTRFPDRPQGSYFYVAPDGNVGLNDRNRSVSLTSKKGQA